MKLHLFSYRYALEILEHPRFAALWGEIKTVLAATPVPLFANKSVKQPALDVVQQVMNAYYDVEFSVARGWAFHPTATRIQGSGLAADFRKGPETDAVQMEVQFGNMARWYSDIFKLQAAYSQKLAAIGVSVVPMFSLAKRIDGNVVNFERAKRELPSADLSITLPIILIGLEADETSSTVDLRTTSFQIGQITRIASNCYRIVNAIRTGQSLAGLSDGAITGPIPAAEVHEEPAENNEDA
jgi:hypothetical protein